MAYIGNRTLVREIELYAAFAKEGGLPSLQSSRFNNVGFDKNPEFINSTPDRATGNAMIAMTRHTIPQLNAMSQQDYVNILDRDMQNDPTFQASVIRGLHNCVEGQPEQVRAFLQAQGVSVTGNNLTAAINSYASSVNGNDAAVTNTVTNNTPSAVTGVPMPPGVSGATPMPPTTDSDTPMPPGTGNTTTTTTQTALPVNGITQLQGLMGVTDPSFTADNITGAFNPETNSRLAASGVTPTELTAELERKAREETSAARFNTLLTDANAPGASSGIVAIFQAILKALGFDVDVNGTMDAKTEAAAPDAQTLIENREAITTEVTDAADALVSARNNEAGLDIVVDGHTLNFTKEEIIAHGGSLEELLLNNADQVVALELAKGETATTALIGVAGIGEAELNAALTALTVEGAPANAARDAVLGRMNADAGTDLDTDAAGFTPVSYRLIPGLSGSEIIGTNAAGEEQSMASITTEQLLNPAEHSDEITAFFDMAANESDVLEAFTNAINALPEAQRDAVIAAYTGNNADVTDALNPPTTDAAPSEDVAPVNQGSVDPILEQAAEFFDDAREATADAIQDNPVTTATVAAGAAIGALNGVRQNNLAATTRANILADAALARADARSEAEALNDVTRAEADAEATRARADAASNARDTVNADAQARVQADRQFTPRTTAPDSGRGAALLTGIQNLGTRAANLGSRALDSLPPSVRNSANRTMAEIQTRVTEAAANGAVRREGISGVDTDGNPIPVADADRTAIDTRTQADVDAIARDAAQPSGPRRALNNSADFIRTNVPFTQSVIPDFRGGSDVIIAQAQAEAHRIRQDVDVTISTAGTTAADAELQKAQDVMDQRLADVDTAHPNIAADHPELTSGQRRGNVIKGGVVGAIITGAASLALYPSMGLASTVLDVETTSPEAMEAARNGHYDEAADLLLEALGADGQANGSWMGVYGGMNNASPEATKALASMLAADAVGDIDAANAYYTQAGFGITAMVGEDAMSADTLGESVSIGWNNVVMEGLGFENVTEAWQVVRADEEKTMLNAIETGAAMTALVVADNFVSGAHYLIVQGAEFGGSDLPSREDLVRDVKYGGFAGFGDFLWENDQERAFKEFHREFDGFIREHGVDSNAPQSAIDLANLHVQWLNAEAAFEALKSQKAPFYAMHDDGVDREQLASLRQSAANAKGMYETQHTAMTETGEIMSVLGYMSAMEHHSVQPTPDATPAPSPTEISNAFAAATPETLPEIEVSTVGMMRAGVGPFQIANDGLASYQTLFEEKPALMADRVKDAMSLADIDPADFADAKTAIAAFYENSMLAQFRPEGEQAAVMAGLDVLAERLGIAADNNAPSAPSSDHQLRGGQAGI